MRRWVGGKHNYCAVPSPQKTLFTAPNLHQNETRNCGHLKIENNDFANESIEVLPEVAALNV